MFTRSFPSAADLHQEVRPEMAALRQYCLFGSRGPQDVRRDLPEGSQVHRSQAALVFGGGFSESHLCPRYQQCHGNDLATFQNMSGSLGKGVRQRNGADDGFPASSLGKPPPPLCPRDTPVWNVILFFLEPDKVTFKIHLAVVARKKRV